MDFKLTIKLGNAAMQTPDDVAEALRKLAAKMDHTEFSGLEFGSIRDVNGNTVGSWELTP